MKACSFVIPFHTIRLANLEQMIGLLFTRESRLSSVEHEFILVCHDEWDGPLAFGNSPVKLINLRHSIYHRAKACNIGVQAAKHPVVFLLDSDRVLPRDYFYRTLNELEPKELRFAGKLYQIQQLTTDSQILRGKFLSKPDFKSETVQFHKKNAFSGNTAFHRDDYLAFGGMDEDYIGYGYQDNDACMRALQGGCKLTMTDDEELHLYHPEQLVVGDVVKAQRTKHAYLMMNLVRYCTKWKIEMPDRFRPQANNVAQQPENYTQELSDAMIKLLSEYGSEVNKALKN